MLSKIVVVDVVDDGSGVIYLRLDDIGELSSMAKEVAGRVTCGSILLGVSWLSVDDHSCCSTCREKRKK